MRQVSARRSALVRRSFYVAQSLGLHRRSVGVLSAVVVLALAGATAARADSVGPITFEPSQGYVPGDINGQQGWQKLNPLFDVKVATISSYPAAAGYGFQLQALQLSDFFTSGSFGDQTFSPGLLQPAGESPLQTHFDASFKIGTSQATEQAGLHMSVSPDDGEGGRMSYLRFEDQSNGVHVFFVDVENEGPFPTVSDFPETEIATLNRTRAHSIRFSIDFRTGPDNDVVKIYIDGALRKTGTTWEDYYRYDPEAIAHAGQPPPVRKLLFRESGDAHPANLGKGFLVDYVFLASFTRDQDEDCVEQDGDHDGLSDNRESLFLTLLGVRDSNFNGVYDGNDDSNHNNVDDEDEDDGGNECANDSNHDGRNDEDEDDDDDGQHHHH
jgi:hypothetical protein